LTKSSESAARPDRSIHEKPYPRLLTETAKREGRLAAATNCVPFILRPI
jgi:hypothetical protein